MAFLGLQVSTLFWDKDFVIWCVWEKLARIQVSIYSWVLTYSCCQVVIVAVTFKQVLGVTYTSLQVCPPLLVAFPSLSKV